MTEPLSDAELDELAADTGQCDLDGGCRGDLMATAIAALRSRIAELERIIGRGEIPGMDGQL